MCNRGDERFGKEHGVIYVDKPEDVLWRAVELIGEGMVEEYGVKAWRFVENSGWDDVVDDFEGILEGLA